MSEVRNTRKSRIVEQIADAIAELVSGGDTSPSKSEIVSSIVNGSLNEAASPAIRAMLEDEVANNLDRYFSESCEAASKLLAPSGVPAAFHYVTTSYYKARRPVPRSEEEARQYVVCFGNGRTGKAAGVRYPTAEDEPDAMLLIHLQKSSETIRKAVETHNAKFVERLSSPAIGDFARGTLFAEMPRLLTS